MSDNIVLPPRLFPSARYYRILAFDENAKVNTSERYDKRSKAVHRYEILDARGRLQLTVPLTKPHDCDHPPTWNDALVSTHDQWWHKHRTALESAYGRTPYFEFLIDKFNNIFRSPEQWDQWPTAIDLIREANSVILGILDIPPSVREHHYEVSVSSYNNSSDEKVAEWDWPDQPPYWQVRKHLHGFQPGLSILDLIFNLGPESSMYLLKSLNS